MLEEKGDPVEIMPIRFAQQHRVETVGGLPLSTSTFRAELS
jgi:hypothetical protein